MASKEIIAQKEQLVSEVAEKISKAKSIVLVNHCGLTVEQDTELRAEMRKANVEYKVIKNSILSRAFEKVGFTGFEGVFSGPTAAAFSYDDAVAGAKIISDNGAKTKMLEIKGGVIENKAATAEEVKVLANIPPKPVREKREREMRKAYDELLAIGREERKERRGLFGRRKKSK